MNSPELKELDGTINDRRKQLATVLAEAGETVDMAKVKSIEGDSTAKVDQIRAWNEELDALGAKRAGLVTLLKAADHASKYGDDEAAAESATLDGKQSFGDRIVKSTAFTAKAGAIGPVATLEGVSVKTLLTSTTGWQPETFRNGRVIDFATRPVELVGLIPIVPINQNANVYMEETTFTNPAAEVVEGGAFPEATLAYTEQTSPVRKIPVFIPVTDEQLEDVDGMAARLNARLPFMIQQRLALQLLVGNGTAPNLRGINNTVGIQTQAKGADPVPDAIYKAIVKCQTIGFVEPDAYVTNPTDWQDVRLLRTADGIYIWGSPSEAGPEMVWGLKVVKAVAQTLDTGLVGDFGNYAEISERRGIDVQVSNSHGTFFVEGKQAVRADIRVALTVYRPSAFCTVTGI